ncbi:SMI1 / KNR4 family (SUKH-1) [Andreprevotia lacus DSM 23236]|jgi:hypothetical protein|uniref:SMI1 / KNR4 family (SUKH-1) n=1 Tax=Andreprevotia lacus DSM 23236 TaxID=1121001 RepID=A0A1W1XY18_9NEIS|nr:SMI1/KNR4 family protein [Andreprevotia lacus]SMC28850.1 SMI1 / KNR4 family (SUKH-1) [Andreprevotia lacus DSM 23236]
MFKINEKDFDQFRESFERAKGIELPDDYVFFLKKVDLPDFLEVNFSQHEFANATVIKNWYGFGVRNEINLNTNYDFYVSSGRVPSEVLPIAEDVAGNLFCLGLKGDSQGRIYFWDHEEELNVENLSDLTVVANTFRDFIRAIAT